VQREDAVPIIAVNEPLLDLLDRRRIFHDPYGGRRWRIGDRLPAPEAFEIEGFSHLFSGARLPTRFGAFSYSYSALRQHVSVGRYCSIGAHVFWIGQPHPTNWATTSPVAFRWDLPGLREFTKGADTPLEVFNDNLRPVTIGNDVWIGDQVSIAPGVSIGNGSVIGARSLVLKDVPPYSIVAGAPAQLIRKRFSPDIAERLQASAWWDHMPLALRGLPFEDPELFLAALEKRAPPRMTVGAFREDDLAGIST
jgi:acetyltransferase-like isoleucine patch superfamily enzyme